MTLFLAEQRPTDERHVRQRGWREVAHRGIEILLTGGSHLTMLHEPWAAGLAEQLDRRPQQAQAAAPEQAL